MLITSTFTLYPGLVAMPQSGTVYRFKPFPDPTGVVGASWANAAGLSLINTLASNKVCVVNAGRLPVICKLYNMTTGQWIESVCIKPGSTDVDVSAYVPGTYLFLYGNGFERGVLRFVKQ